MKEINIITDGIRSINIIDNNNRIYLGYTIEKSDKEGKLVMMAFKAFSN